MNLVKVISTDYNTIKQRVIKFLRMGRIDIQTSIESAPYGIDSNPVEKMIAIYGPTADKSQTVILGYLNKNQLAKPGEMRCYSTDANGALKFYTWLKNDGTMEIGGTADHMVRYSKLETAYNQLKTDHDTLVTAFNAHIAAVALILGTPAVPVAPSTGNISPAKINEIKTL